jgi:hypothetical protein
MKKIVITTALFVSAGVFVSAGLLPSNNKQTKIIALIPVEQSTAMAMKNLGTAD